MASKHKSKSLYHPVNWPYWLVVFILYCLSFLPMQTKQRFGVKLGRLVKRLQQSDRAGATEKNIAACFPELSKDEQDALVEQAYISVAKGFLESAHFWWRDITHMVNNMTVVGEEHIREAQSRGKGVLMIGGHYSILDLALLLAYVVDKPGYVYRPNNNPVIDQMIEKGRGRHKGVKGFSKRRVGKMIEFLNQGGAVWYAPDQDFGAKSKLFVPFFGVQTGCISMPSKIARESGTTVLCVAHLRRPDGQYELRFSPILEDFGQDEEKDALAWNQFLEQNLREFPEQYLWMHKRFKTRPEGAPEIY